MSKKYKIILFFLVIVVMSCIFLSLHRASYPNILLISVDALRPDHLGYYRYKRNTSPNIDNLANEGVCFLKCFATSSATLFASPALLTGRYLGIRNNAVLIEEYDYILDKKFTTLAEYLKKFGYYTVAFLNNEHYRPRTGFEQGFDCYEVLDETAEGATNRILNFLNRYQYNKPLFVWIHYIDPHSPYTPPKKYFKVFENDRLYKDNDKTLKLNPENDYRPFVSKGYIPRIVFQEGKYSLNYYIGCYDGEISYTDFHIGRLLKNIKDNTLIILTADHGESLGEHNTYFHHENMYDEVLHVPLIVKDNRDFKGGKAISHTVSSVDIAPTILSRINPIWYLLNKNNFDGRDLKGLLKNKKIKRKYIYSYSSVRLSLNFSVRDVERNIKYIWHKKDNKEELYFLPDEDKNLICDESLKITSIRDEFRDNLKVWSKNYPIQADINPEKVSLGEDVKSNLRNLGYLH